MNTILTHRAIYAGLCLACVACSQPAPSEPSAAFVPGTYELTITRCGVSGDLTPQVEASFPPFGPSSIQIPWTLSQTGSELSGSTSGSVPPFSWGGTLTGRVTSASRIEISSLSYRDSSSHGGSQRLSGTGVGTVDPASISGIFAGDYTFTPTFGGLFAGPSRTCQGVQMPMRFSRRQ